MTKMDKLFKSLNRSRSKIKSSTRWANQLHKIWAEMASRTCKSKQGTSRWRSSTWTESRSSKLTDRFIPEPSQKKTLHNTVSLTKHSTIVSTIIRTTMSSLSISRASAFLIRGLISHRGEIMMMLLIRCCAKLGRSTRWRGCRIRPTLSPPLVLSILLWWVTPAGWWQPHDKSRTNSSSSRSSSQTQTSALATPQKSLRRQALVRITSGIERSLSRSTSSRWWATFRRTDILCRTLPKGIRLTRPSYDTFSSRSTNLWVSLSLCRSTTFRLGPLFTQAKVIGTS